MINSFNNDPCKSNKLNCIDNENAMLALTKICQRGLLNINYVKQV